MKIKIRDLILDNAIFLKTDDTLIIQVNEDINPFEAMPLFNGQNAIQYMNDEDVVETFEGDYSFKQCEQRNGMVIYTLSLPSPLEKAQKEIKGLNEQITNLELALCEIYESMGV